MIFFFPVKQRLNWHRHDYSEIDDGKVSITISITSISNHHELEDFLKLITGTGASASPFLC